MVTNKWLVWKKIHQILVTFYEAIELQCYLSDPLNSGHSLSSCQPLSGPVTVCNVHMLIKRRNNWDNESSSISFEINTLTENETNERLLLSVTLQLFVARPTKRASMVQGRYLGGFRAQGRSPDTPGKHKNAAGPVGILLKRGAQEPGDKLSPFRDC